jgi:WD40 repeat protein
LLQIDNILGQHGPVVGVAFSPDGRRTASGSTQFGEDKPSYLKVWDATTSQEVLQPDRETMSAMRLAFSRDGRWLAAGTEGGKVNVWDATTGKLAHTLEQSPNVWGIAFSRDSQRLGTLNRWGIVTVHDATRWSGRAPLTFRAHKITFRGNLAFSPDGQRFVVPGDDNTVNICDVTATDQPPTTPDSPCAATPPRSGAWRTAPTAVGSPRAVRITP